MASMVVVLVVSFSFGTSVHYSLFTSCVFSLYLLYRFNVNPNIIPLRLASQKEREERKSATFTSFTINCHDDGGKSGNADGVNIEKMAQLCSKE